MQSYIIKFGGSSLADEKKFLYIAKKIKNLKKIKKNIICILSAPSDITDDLIKISNNFKKNKREMDLLLSSGEQISVNILSMALNSINVKTISYNAYQLPIKINLKNELEINHKKIKEAFKKNNVILITGFQAINSNNDLITLGRGGSDFTALSFAKSLNTKTCTLYSDVKGVYSANPSLINSAIKLNEISCSELIELSKNGIEVRQLKALILAKKYKVNIILASSFLKDKGTLIKYQDPNNPEIKAISFQNIKNKIKVSLIGYLPEKTNNFKNKILSLNIKPPFKKNKYSYSFYINQNSNLNLIHSTFIKEN